ncbi:ankyrin repeat domain-containing protein [Halothiobacillus sp.]|uniref:ankyrin repeat domain-containing protein n=1 Tax=Halothiobacillus sp. TaxID=1891311 RepID=UPI002AD331D6|nr:ankyrin repeat domain-containing protein [Halothiobacillus sp.]
MDYGVGEQILAIQLARKWAELIGQGQRRLANMYYDEAIKKFPWINEIMVYGGSEAAGAILAKELVKQGKVSINVTIKDGSTALLYAAYFDNRKAANELLDLHADPNISDNSGLTPLMSAAQNGDIILAQMLLKHGANSNALMQGWKAADFAARRGDKKLESLLRNAEIGKRN